MGKYLESCRSFTLIALLFCAASLILPHVPKALGQSSNNIAADNASGVGSTANSATLSEQMSALNWIHGAASINIAKVATLNLPAGYTALIPPDSESFLRLNGNPTPAGRPDDFIVASENNNATWFADLSYIDVGYIRDNDTFDPKSLLKIQQDLNERDNTLRQQQKMNRAKFVGWALLPSYNPDTHRVEWAFQLASSDGARTEDLNIRVLSRKGYIHVILVDTPDRIPTDMPILNSLISGLTIDEGNQYADYKLGDRLAPYGINGLISR